MNFLRSPTEQTFGCSAEIPVKKCNFTQKNEYNYHAFSTSAPTPDAYVRNMWKSPNIVVVKSL